MRLEYTSYTLHFKFQIKTSRGTLTERKVWFIKIYDNHGSFGFGEIAPIRYLSSEDIEKIPAELSRIKSAISSMQAPTAEKEIWKIIKKLIINSFSSIQFGLEVALFDLLNGGQKKIFRHDLSKINVPINGLVWMGKTDFIREQIKEKLDAGFTCIKLKIGALDFKTELSIIKELRNISDDLVIRLDANGAFEINKVLHQLEILSDFNIHSIEQPILPNQPEVLKIICQKSQISIALDEELISINNEHKRLKFLQEIKPHYLVLKPTLHGGFASIKNWINLAEKEGVKWWVTSYLESNIGLNAIAQFVSLYKNSEHHGLGTGSLYHNNIASPIVINKGYLQYAPSFTWSDISF